MYDFFKCSVNSQSLICIFKLQLLQLGLPGTLLTTSAHVALSIVINIILCSNVVYITACLTVYFVLWKKCIEGNSWQAVHNV